MATHTSPHDYDAFSEPESCSTRNEWADSIDAAGAAADRASHHLLEVADELGELSDSDDPVAVAAADEILSRVLSCLDMDFLPALSDRDAWRRLKTAMGE